MSRSAKAEASGYRSDVVQPAVHCPFCRSEDTRCEAAFGTAHAYSQFYCRACRTPIRAFRQEVTDHIGAHKPLIDVRSPGEYSGELLHMPDYPQEGALRGGHIPGAASVPWGQAVAPNGTFKSADELKALYEGRAGLKQQDDVVVYCRIGERSSHTWFVLTYLLGYPQVRNYDGSWTEWGNLVGAPIEKTA